MASLSPLWVKITDFGISKRWADTALQTRCGTILYQAPELHRVLPKEMRTEGDQYTWAVDMWALGAIVHEVLTSQIPFTEVRSVSAGSTIFGSTATSSAHDGWLLAQYCSGKPFPVASLNEQGADATAIGFVKRLMVVNPKDRVSAADALSDAWFSEILPTPLPWPATASPWGKSFAELANESAATPPSQSQLPTRNLTPPHHQTAVPRSIPAAPFGGVATPRVVPPFPPRNPFSLHYPAAVPVPVSYPIGVPVPATVITPQTFFSDWANERVARPPSPPPIRLRNIFAAVPEPVTATSRQNPPSEWANERGATPPSQLLFGRANPIQRNSRTAVPQSIPATAFGTVAMQALSPPEYPTPPQHQTAVPTALPIRRARRPKFNRNGKPSPDDTLILYVVRAILTEIKH